MKKIKERLAAADWQAVGTNMHEKGWAILPEIVAGETCKELIGQYNQPELYRKTVTMERYRFGLGEYKYFNYPLPPLIQTIREEVYKKIALSPIAGWRF